MESDLSHRYSNGFWLPSMQKKPRETRSIRNIFMAMAGKWKSCLRILRHHLTCGVCFDQAVDQMTVSWRLNNWDAESPPPGHSLRDPIAMVNRNRNFAYLLTSCVCCFLFRVLRLRCWLFGFALWIWICELLILESAHGKPPEHLTSDSDRIHH